MPDVEGGWAGRAPGDYLVHALVDEHGEHLGFKKPANTRIKLIADVTFDRADSNSPTWPGKADGTGLGLTRRIFCQSSAEFQSAGVSGSSQCLCPD